MTPPYKRVYPDIPVVPDWSVIRFSFESDFVLDREIRPEPTIICSRCHMPQPLDNYYKDSHAPSGYKSGCKSCRSKSLNHVANRSRGKRFRERNPGKYKEKNRIHAKTFTERHPERRKAQKKKFNVSSWDKNAILRIRYQCKQAGVPFNIVADDLLPLPEYCPVFGMRLVYDASGQRRCWASVDRIIPVLGYTKGNVRVISMSANLAKMDGVGDITIIRPKKERQIFDQPSLFD